MRSMRLFLLFSFSALMSLQTNGFTDESDKKALLDFKSQVSEDKQNVLSSWNNSSPLCSWKGVTCGLKHKRVTGLDLGGSELVGVIPPSIGNLSFLMSLDLSNNSISGNIPHKVGNLFRLEYLVMSHNDLTGDIPVGLSNCSRLFYLDLFGNDLGGVFPSELGSLGKLESLDLGFNKLRGKLPASFANLTSLTDVSIYTNKIEKIPDDLSRLNQLEYLILGGNPITGPFPPSLYNISSLEELAIHRMGLSGSLKPDFGNLLPNLRFLAMGHNSLTGPIPTTLSNISNLQELGIEYNKMMGSIPSSFGKLKNLRFVLLHGNSLGSYSSGDLEFLKALTNCTKLHLLSVGINRLGGHLPTAIANLSTNLLQLNLINNSISGTIPYDIGNLIGLNRLVLGINMLTGPLPNSIGKLSSLVDLELTSNRMSGEIPSSLGNITRLEKLYLNNNSFQGAIPPSLAQLKYMLKLTVGSNKLNGTIPREIMQIQSLVHLDLSNNSFTGSLPDYTNPLESLGTLSVAHNKLSGQIPQVLGDCLQLENLYLQGNSFDGDIPNIERLMGAKILDFSNNNLSGSIPGYFANFSSLEYLNLSVNNFVGKVPTEGKFRNAKVVTVFGNKDLCGGIKELKLTPCIAHAQPLETTKHPSLSKKLAFGVSLGIALLLMVFIAYVSLRWFRKGKKNQEITNPTSSSSLEVFHEKVSYAYLRNATDGFSPSNLIGSGSFGTVFKALLPRENKAVAVKVLNMQRRGAMKSFMRECESLKDIRHRNLVKLLTACSSVDFQGKDFRALIYEFMPNGSLDVWLHPEEVEEIHRPLTLFERLSIAIDVVSVLDYLHVYCHEQIAHCDLKPSNVLLDDDMTGHVSDFGIARLLMKFDQESLFNHLSSAGVRGTIGYAPPEYGMGGQPSIHGDMYSFGVLLLEMFTGKRPTNELFGGNVTLQSYTKLALPERVLDIAENSILSGGLGVGFPLVECLTQVFEVGLKCCEESPNNRLAASEASKELILIKEKFFKARNTARR